MASSASLSLSKLLLATGSLIIVLIVVITVLIALLVAFIVAAILLVGIVCVGVVVASKELVSNRGELREAKTEGLRFIIVPISSLMLLLTIVVLVLISRILFVLILDIVGVLLMAVAIIILCLRIGGHFSCEERSFSGLRQYVSKS